jgi:hypothetical protein
MAHNPASELVSALQSVSINKAPSAEHDINPSTAASKKYPAEIVSPPQSPSRHSHTLSSASSSDSTIPSDIIRPRPRRRTLPPFPDFRFEQSYLASLKTAESNWQIAYITIRDQVIWPLVSGAAYNLIMFGWRHWNRETNFKGTSVGTKVRKWWWGVNNWKIPDGPQGKKIAKDTEEVRLWVFDQFS